MYYRNASAAMLVYDVTNSKSFEEIRGWVTELQSNTDEGTCTDAVAFDVCFRIACAKVSVLPPFPVRLSVICLLANKVDLLETEADGADAIAKGRHFADAIGALFFKTSAPANEGALCAGINSRQQDPQPDIYSLRPNPHPSFQALTTLFWVSCSGCW
jgi:hypothetical protein